MSKRANGEGSVYQRKDGRWTGATYVLRPDGKRQRRQVYGSTRAEAASRVRELIAQAERGIPGVGTTWTVETYSVHWLRDATAGLRPATRSNYAWVLKKHVLPILGTVRLDRLGRSDIQRLHSTMAGQGSSARLQQLAHAVLRSMLSEAVREEQIGRNVAGLVRAPRPQREEVVPWTQEEVARFEKVAKEHRLHALFLLAYSVGLRRRELLGLRWADVDLAQGKLHVRQTLQRLGAGAGLVLGPPKSARSRRTVPLPAIARSALTAHRMTAVTPPADGDPRFADLVFTTSSGTPIEPSNLRRDLDGLIELAGVRRIRFHDLRHTCASLLFAQGVPPRVVMDLLGHSTLSITTDIYAHVMQSALTDAAAAMDALFKNGAAVDGR